MRKPAHSCYQTSHLGPSTATSIVELYTSAINISAGVTVDVNMGATNFTVDGTTFTGAGTLVKQGSGIMLLGESAYNTTVAMTGTIEVASGVLSNDYGNGANSAVNWSNNTATLQLDAGAVFDLRNNNATVGALTGSGTVQDSYLSNTLTVGNGNASGTFSGTIAVAAVAGLGAFGPQLVNLVKAGTGTETLTGTNTYSGTTTVSGGTLAVGNGGTTGKLGTGAVTDNANLVINYSSAVNVSAVASNTAGITGTGNLTAISNGALGIDRAINLSSGNGNILLEAGAATPAGTASGGDVTATSGISTGSGGTITVFSGDPNTATLMAEMSGASSLSGLQDLRRQRERWPVPWQAHANFYYRSTETETLANLTATKVYDGTAEAATAVKTVFVTGVDGDATTNLNAINLAAAFYNTSHAGTNWLVDAPLLGNMTYTSGATT